MLGALCFTPPAPTYYKRWDGRTGLDHLYLVGYSESMNTILRTEVFDAWLKKLTDTRGKARILERIRTAERGNFGDCDSVGQGVSEMRIHFAPGYRLYFTQFGPVVYILLCGGIMRNQQRDIAKARDMAKVLNEEES